MGHHVHNSYSRNVLYMDTCSTEIIVDFFVCGVPNGVAKRKILATSAEVTNRKSYKIQNLYGLTYVVHMLYGNTLEPVGLWRCVPAHL